MKGELSLEERRVAAKAMREAGMTLTQIGNVFGVHASTVSGWADDDYAEHRRRFDRENKRRRRLVDPDYVARDRAGARERDRRRRARRAASSAEEVSVTG